MLDLLFIVFGFNVCYVLYYCYFSDVVVNDQLIYFSDVAVNDPIFIL